MVILMLKIYQHTITWTISRIGLINNIDIISANNGESSIIIFSLKCFFKIFFKQFSLIIILNLL